MRVWGRQSTLWFRGAGGVREELGLECASGALERGVSEEGSRGDSVELALECRLASAATKVNSVVGSRRLIHDSGGKVQVVNLERFLLQERGLQRGVFLCGHCPLSVGTLGVVGLQLRLGIRGLLLSSLQSSS